MNSTKENLLKVDSSVQLQWKNISLNYCNPKFNLIGEESDLHSGKIKIRNRGLVQICNKNDLLGARKYIKSLIRYLFTSGVNLLLTGNDLWVTGKNLWVSGNDLKMTGNHLWDSGNELRMTGNQLWVSGSNLWVTGNDLGANGSKLWLNGNNLRHIENEFWITENNMIGKNHDLRIKIKFKSGRND